MVYIKRMDEDEKHYKSRQAILKAVFGEDWRKIEQQIIEEEQEAKDDNGS